jgi:hypothetical protein
MAKSNQNKKASHSVGKAFLKKSLSLLSFLILSPATYSYSQHSQSFSRNHNQNPSESESQKYSFAFTFQHPHNEKIFKVQIQGEEHEFESLFEQASLKCYNHFKENLKSLKKNNFDDHEDSLDLIDTCANPQIHKK